MALADGPIQRISVIKELGLDTDPPNQAYEGERNYQEAVVEIIPVANNSERFFAVRHDGGSSFARCSLDLVDISSGKILDTDSVTSSTSTISSLRQGSLSQNYKSFNSGIVGWNKNSCLVGDYSVLAYFNFDPLPDEYGISIYALQDDDGSISNTVSHVHWDVTPSGLDHDWTFFVYPRDDNSFFIVCAASSSPPELAVLLMNLDNNGVATLTSLDLVSNWDSLATWTLISAPIFKNRPTTSIMVAIDFLPDEAGNGVLYLDLESATFLGGYIVDNYAPLSYTAFAVPLKGDKLIFGLPGNKSVGDNNNGIPDVEGFEYTYHAPDGPSSTGFTGTRQQVDVAPDSWVPGHEWRRQFGVGPENHSKAFTAFWDVVNLTDVALPGTYGIIELYGLDIDDNGETVSVEHERIFAHPTSPDNDIERLWTEQDGAVGPVGDYLVAGVVGQEWFEEFGGWFDTGIWYYVYDISELEQITSITGIDAYRDDLHIVDKRDPSSFKVINRDSLQLQSSKQVPDLGYPANPWGITVNNNIAWFANQGEQDQLGAVSIATDFVIKTLPAPGDKVYDVAWSQDLVEIPELETFQLFYLAGFDEDNEAFIINADGSIFVKIAETLGIDKTKDWNVFDIQSDGDHIFITGHEDVFAYAAKVTVEGDLVWAKVVDDSVIGGTDDPQLLFSRLAPDNQGGVWTLFHTSDIFLEELSQRVAKFDSSGNLTLGEELPFSGSLHIDQVVAQSHAEMFLVSRAGDNLFRVTSNLQHTSIGFNFDTATYGLTKILFHTLGLYGDIIILVQDYRVSAVNKNTGALIWQIDSSELIAGEVFGGAVISNGVLYVDTSFETPVPSPLNSRILRIDLSTGDILHQRIIEVSAPDPFGGVLPLGRVLNSNRVITKPGSFNQMLLLNEDLTTAEVFDLIPDPHVTEFAFFGVYK